MKRKIASLLLAAQSFFLFACSSIEVDTEQETESRVELKVAFQGPNPAATKLYIDKFMAYFFNIITKIYRSDYFGKSTYCVYTKEKC